MAILLEIFSLYQFTSIDNSIEYLLLRTSQPAYSNANQRQEEIAIQIEMEKRQLLLNLYCNQYAKNAQIEFIGELQQVPIGEKLFSEIGKFRIPIFYQQTEYGFPWIILGNAASIESFEKELKEDCDLLSLKPTGAVKSIDTVFITENDFDLSQIKNFNAKDIRDI